MLRTHMMSVLVTGQPQPPLGKADLSFTQWLSQNSVFSLTTKSRPGPIPPEVYDVLDSIIYDGLGIPRVVSATQVSLLGWFLLLHAREVRCQTCASLILRAPAAHVAQTLTSLSTSLRRPIY